MLGGASVFALVVVLITRAKRRPSGGSFEEMVAKAGPDIRASRPPRTPLVAELMTMATDHLGNRARKVHEILLKAEPTPDGLLVATDTIANVSLLFVNQERITELVQQMKAKIGEIRN